MAFRSAPFGAGTLAERGRQPDRATAASSGQWVIQNDPFTWTYEIARKKVSEWFIYCVSNAETQGGASAPAWAAVTV